MQCHMCGENASPTVPPAAVCKQPARHLLPRRRPPSPSCPSPCLPTHACPLPIDRSATHARPQLPTCCRGVDLHRLLVLPLALAVALRCSGGGGGGLRRVAALAAGARRLLLLLRFLALHHLHLLKHRGSRGGRARPAINRRQTTKRREAHHSTCMKAALQMAQEPLTVRSRGWPRTAGRTAAATTRLTMVAPLRSESWPSSSMSSMAMPPRPPGPTRGDDFLFLFFNDDDGWRFGGGGYMSTGVSGRVGGGASTSTGVDHTALEQKARGQRSGGASARDAGQQASHSNLHCRTQLCRSQRTRAHKPHHPHHTPLVTPERTSLIWKPAPPAGMPSASSRLSGNEVPLMTMGPLQQHGARASWAANTDRTEEMAHRRQIAHSVQADGASGGARCAAARPGCLARQAEWRLAPARSQNRHPGRGGGGTAQHSALAHPCRAPVSPLLLRLLPPQRLELLAVLLLQVGGRRGDAG